MRPRTALAAIAGTLARPGLRRAQPARTLRVGVDEDVAEYLGS